MNILNIIAAPTWAAILSTAQGLGSMLDLPAWQTTLTASAPPDDFAELGHIFKVESTKPEYELNSHTLPKQILQMAYLKLFIPLITDYVGTGQDSIHRWTQVSKEYLR